MTIDLLKISVLFIEDDRMNRRVVRDMVEVAGGLFSEADSGEEGLRLIEAMSFDVILVDLRMPGMNGYEVIGHVRARSDAKGKLPIIVVTADTADDLRDRCIAAGADAVLYKPIAMDDLFETMGRILAERGGTFGGLSF